MIELRAFINPQGVVDAAHGALLRELASQDKPKWIQAPPGTYTAYDIKTARGPDGMRSGYTMHLLGKDTTGDWQNGLQTFDEFIVTGGPDLNNVTQSLTVGEGGNTPVLSLRDDIIVVDGVPFKKGRNGDIRVSKFLSSGIGDEFGPFVEGTFVASFPPQIDHAKYYMSAPQTKPSSAGTK